MPKSRASSSNSTSQLVFPFDKNEFNAIIKENRFTILVFYRGGWCSVCKDQLCKINPLYSKIKKMGGEIIAISAESYDTSVETFQDLNLSFPLLSDEKNNLAKKYKVEITDRKASIWDKFLTIAKKAGANVSPLQKANTYQEGMSQPAIVVFDQTGDLIFSWKKFPLLKNYYGATDRMAVEDVLNIVEFMLSPTYTESRLKIKDGKDSELFEHIIITQKLKEKFIAHLKKEYNYELLEFVDDVRQFEKAVTLEEKTKLANLIFDTYIIDSSKKELNLASHVRNHLVQFFGKDQEVCPPSNLFHESLMHAKTILYTDCFNRFKKTKDFYEMVKDIPQFFTTP